MAWNYATNKNKSPKYCKSCAKHSMSKISESGKQVNMLCGLCGRIRALLKENIIDLKAVEDK